MHKLIFLDKPVLRQTAKEVDNIQSQNTQKVIQDMKTILHSEKYGVAIAAPQIGESLRLFIIGGPVFASRKKENYDEKLHPDKVFINPEVIKVSKKTSIGDEGCLSVPNKYGTKVERSEKITIFYSDEKGIRHTRGASGFLARVFQHEIDHLNGILYIDNALEVISVDENLKPI